MANFVLIHGGFCGGWYWKKIKKILERAGHTVYTPTLTGLGARCHLNGPYITLDTHIQDINNLFLFEEIKNAILVGHSYGGLVITGVAHHNPSHIDRLIYLDGLIPDSGDSLMSLVDEQTAQFFTDQVHEKGNGWAIPAPTIQTKNTNDTAWLNKHFTSQSLASFTEPLFFNIQTIDALQPSFIFCTQNNHPTIVNMAKKAQLKKWHYSELESDHFSMINEPKKLSVLLLQAVLKPAL